MASSVTFSNEAIVSPTFAFTVRSISYNVLCMGNHSHDFGFALYHLKPRASSLSHNAGDHFMESMEEKNPTFVHCTRLLEYHYLRSENDDLCQRSRVSFFNY